MYLDLLHPPQEEYVRNGVNKLSLMDFVGITHETETFTGHDMNKTEETAANMQLVS